MKKIIYILLIILFLAGCVREDIHPAKPDTIKDAECEVDSDCKISGCNGEICAKEEMHSICIFKPEFECYKIIACKCIEGKCGWEQSPELLECLAQYK